MDKGKRPNLKKNPAPKLTDLDIEQRRKAILKQKHCNAVALHIVSKHIDCPVEEDVFLQSLKYLSQSHYEDIVEERAISKMCGYPICASILPDMPAKKYHISAKSNKIYDITERKNYCSNYCFAASNHIKAQILTSPLWYRDQEHIPDFQLLPRTEKGIPGEEIDQGIIRVPKETDPEFISITQFTQEVLNDIPDNYTDDNNDDTKVDENKVSFENETVNKPNNDIGNNNNDVKTCPSSSNNNWDASTSKDENFFYSKMFVPSLADILTENAKYFENVETKLNSDSDNEISSTNSLEHSDKPKVKGILSKNNKQKSKKSVSFSSTESVSEAPKSETNVFKKPISTNILDAKKNTVNLTSNSENIIIDKDSNITNINNKTSTDKTKSFTCTQNKNNVKQIENINTNVNLNHKEHLSKDSLINKRVIEHKSIILPNNTTEKVIDVKKETRKLNFRNSATYAKAKQISKPENNIQNEPINNNFKIRIEKCLQEWCTIDTMIFLYGEQQVKKIVSEKTFKEYLNIKKNTEEEEMKRKQYAAICRRLNLMELADRKFDESVVDDEKKPLPHYDDLKEMAETMDLRVRAFYSGCFEEYDMDNDESAGEEEEESECFDKGAPAVLPLVDSKDYTSLRKKIFLTSLQRIMPSLCDILGQSQHSLMPDLQQLVDTFTFDANNIVFKTAEWPMVAIILIKMLSIQNKDLLQVLEKQKTQDYIINLKKQFFSSDCNLDDFLSKIVDMHHFLQEYLKKTSDLS